MGGGGSSPTEDKSDISGNSTDGTTEGIVETKESTETTANKCTDKEMAYLRSQEYIDVYLKAPSTAVYPENPTSQTVDDNNCIHNIRSYVDSQNGFGAMIRTYFTIEMTYFEKHDDFRMTDEPYFYDNATSGNVSEDVGTDTDTNGKGDTGSIESSGEEQTVEPSAEEQTESSSPEQTESSSEEQAVETEQAKKSYYGINMYEQPDETFSKIDIKVKGMEAYQKDDGEWKIMVLSDKTIGVVKIALVQTFYSDQYGVSANLGYDKYKEVLDAKYETNSTSDACYDSEYVCSADNYAYSFYKKTRFKYTLYDNEDDDIGIMLESSGVYDIDLKIIYETKEFANIVNEYDSSKNDLLKPLKTML